jgi:hypothetical protein
MKSFVTILAITGILITGCGKDSSNSKPTLKLESVSSEIVPQNSDLRVEFSFEDAEGDLDSVYMYKVRVNKLKVTTLRDTLKYAVPANESTKSGTLRIDLDYQNHLISALTPPGSGSNREPDSLVIKFIAKDKAKNISDTVSSPLITVIR